MSEEQKKRNHSSDSDGEESSDDEGNYGPLPPSSADLIPHENEEKEEEKNPKSSEKLLKKRRKLAHEQVSLPFFSSLLNLTFTLPFLRSSWKIFHCHLIMKNLTCIATISPILWSQEHTTTSLLPLVTGTSNSGRRCCRELNLSNISRLT
jgi:hypothetical protein